MALSTSPAPSRRLGRPLARSPLCSTNPIRLTAPGGVDLGVGNFGHKATIPIALRNCDGQALFEELDTSRTRTTPAEAEVFQVSVRFVPAIVIAATFVAHRAANDVHEVPLDPAESRRIPPIARESFARTSRMIRETFARTWGPIREASPLGGRSRRPGGRRSDRSSPGHDKHTQCARMSAHSHTGAGSWSHPPPFTGSRFPTGSRLVPGAVLECAEIMRAL